MQAKPLLIRPSTSRRRGTKRGRRWLPLILSTTAALFMLYFGLSAYMAATLSRTEREAITSSPKDYGLFYQDVSFPSAEDQLTLKGWFIPSPGSTRALILVHGMGHHRDAPDIKMLLLGSKLVRQGFSVLQFDLRGYGESEGKRFSLGFYEPRDVRGAVDYLIKRGYAPGHIGVIGWSMGAATAIISTARDPRIGAVVADSGYADLTDILHCQIPKRSHLPDIFTPGILEMAKLMYGIDVSKIRPVNAISQIAPRHIMIVHGTADPMVPVKNAFRLFDRVADKNANQLWIVPNVVHAAAFKTRPDVYAQRVSSFFYKELR